MSFVKEFFWQILFPMIWLGFFAYAFSSASMHLAKAWKEKKFKSICLYVWVLLVGFYFLTIGIEKDQSNRKSTPKKERTS